MKYTKIPSVLGVVNGIKDHGKSFFVKTYLIPKFAEKKPVIVLDITGEYAAEFPEYVYNSFEEFFDGIYQAEGIKRGVHVLRWKKTGEAVRLIRFLRYIEKPVSLILEEAHILFKNSTIHRQIKEHLVEICFMGAHYGIDAILLSQRAASLPPDVRSQAQFFVSFKQKEQADLDYLRKKGGASDNTCQIVANLKKYEFFSIGEQPTGFSEIKINEVNQL